MKNITRKPVTIKTDVSTAYWYVPNNKKENSFQKAEIPSLMKGNSLSWLDLMLDGGIYMPELKDAKNRALTVLIFGQPGTGKTTLALELCYRWTRNKQVRRRGLDTLYITTETDKNWLVEKACNFGWEDSERSFVCEDKPENKSKIPLVTIWPTTKFDSFLSQTSRLGKTKTAIVKAIENIIKVKGLSEVAEDVKQKVGDKELQNSINKNDPDILVLDSINKDEPTSRSKLYNAFLKLSTCGPKVIFLILDSNTNQSSFQFWEYISDLVIKLDREYNSEYMIRTFEILKARFQAHVWGKHQLKIYPPYIIKNVESERDLRLAHPYREEGGIFIYPSIHFYLAHYKRRSPQSQFSYVQAPVKNLDTILHDGFPKGRCTGFIGMRGGHKSHLGYLHLLKQMHGESDEHKTGKGLVISLRDDEGMVRQTMTKILKQEFPKNKKSISDLEMEEKLDILYFPPGYITPEEFYHRVFITLHRLKRSADDVELTVLFNSLDQLASRFPLCAREEIFIPGLITTFSAEDITSIFVAVEEPGQPPEQYGLLSMADLILSFRRHVFNKEDYCGHVFQSLGDEIINIDQNHAKNGLGMVFQTVVLSVVRFAGGQAAGAAGILELIDRNSTKLKLFEREGLHFVPFSADYPSGELV